MSSALDEALESMERRHSLVQFNTRAGPGAANVLLAGGGTSGAGFLAGLGDQRAMGSAASLYKHNTGWVAACVRAIAQRAAGQPIRVARVLGRGAVPDKALNPRKEFVPKHLKSVQARMELVEDHALLDAFERPNQLMVRWTLAVVTLGNLEITGRMFWWIYEGDRESPTPWTIMPLPSSWVEPKHAPNKVMASWMVRPGNAAVPIEVPASEMLYVYYPDPSNPLSFLSPLQCMARAVIADESIDEAQRRAFSNGIWGGYAITLARQTDINGAPNGPRVKLEKPQRDQLMAAVFQQYQGVRNFDAPFILDDVVESIDKVTNTPREMEFLKSKGITKDQISQGFGVNPIVMGQVEGANRASSAAADDHFCQNTVNPKLDLLSQCMTAWMCPRFAAPGERLVAYFEPAHSYDPDLELSQMGFLMANGALRLNEARHNLGYLPADGGNIALLPAAMKPYNLDEEYDFEAAQAREDAANAAKVAAMAAKPAAVPAKIGTNDNPPADGEGGGAGKGVVSFPVAVVEPAIW